MSAPSLSQYQNGVNQVSGDQLNTFEQTCNTSANLKAFVGTSGMQVYLRGFTAINDGGQGPFYWNSTGTANDGVNNIQPNGVVTGCWTRINDPYQFSATGSVLRTVQSKLSDIVSIEDFGGIGDNTTDNSTAFSAAAAYINASGRPVYCPTGRYRFNAIIPIITGDGGGFYGDGPSSTIFCHTGTSGNTVTLDGSTGANWQTIKNIGFQPLYHKTSGAEIQLQNYTAFPLIEKVSFVYTYQPINVAAVALPTIRDMQTLFSYNAGGHITLKGTGVGNGLVNGIVIDNFNGGTGNEVAGTAFTFWGQNTAYTAGQQVEANGAIWSCVQSGTSASTGTGPMETTYVYASDPWGTPITDGTVKWTFYCQIGCCGILVDSFVFYPSLLNCDINAGDYGLLIQDSVNSGSSAPGEIVASNLFVNYTYRTGVFISAGQGIYLTDPQIGASRTGAGLLTTGNFIGGLTIKGGYSSQNAIDGITLNAGTNINISSIQVQGNSLAASGVNYGINIGANMTKFSVQNTISGALPSAGASQNYGIIIGTGCNYFNVSNNITIGNTNDGVANGSGTSSTKIVSGNI